MTMTQTFRVNIAVPGGALRHMKLADFLDFLADFGSPRIVSYEANRYGYNSHTMVLEFPSYEDAVEFYQTWFGVSSENARECVETVTVYPPNLT